ncbi:MAG: DUF177 domain-containing protein [Brachymonas sp.]|nr:DUF177 domain-containing protein [Brachymonas sp.]
MSSTTFRPDRLDVRAFAQNAAQLSGEITLSKLERLAQDLYRQEADLALKTVNWQASGESVAVTGGAAQSWLHLSMQAQIPLQCQRCLQGMTHSIETEHSFRFVKDEAEANAQDDDAEEDLLVASKQFNLLELIEDELVMALPFVPVHEVCPVPVKLQASSEEYEAALNEKPKAFAALGELKSVLKKAKP